MALALEGVRVLLVEDHADSNETLSSYLRLFGATVVGLTSAWCALDAWKAFDPHVVVADLELPNMDGWQMLKQMREAGMDRPALAVSAHSTERDRERSRQAGYKSHLAKPVTPGQLLAEVQTVLG